MVTSRSIHASVIYWDFLSLLSQIKPAPSVDSKPTEESYCGGGGDHGGWNMGQDDSAVYGKHLPPSPRRQPNKSSLKMSKNPTVPVITTTPPVQDCDVCKSPSRPHRSNSHQTPRSLPLGRQPDSRLSYSPVLTHRQQEPPPSPTLCHTYSSPAPVSQTDYSDVPAGRCRTISDPHASTEPLQTQSQTASTSILRRKVLSKETVRSYQEKALQAHAGRSKRESDGNPSRNRKSAMQVPWEKDASKEGLGLCLGQANSSGPVVQDQGLLEEIESMCCLSSVVHTSLQLSQVHCNSSHLQVQGKATDES